jgi:N-acetylglucosamine malate deacetylase 1
MAMLDQVQRALIIAPHPDDEILGCGGTIARLTAMGREVHVAIVTSGSPPRYEQASVEMVAAETRAAHALLGVAGTHYLEFPAAGLDQVPHADLNAALGNLVAKLAPDTLFLPFVGDVHLDHQLVFQSAMVAARPRGPDCPLRIYAYETLSETNWYAPYVTPGFCPNLFVDISGYSERKLEAFQLHRSQVQQFPNERSIEALRALAKLRGATVHRGAAEAFVIVREIA